MDRWKYSSVSQCVSWTCFHSTSRHAPRCLLLLEVIVDRLIDFFVSGSATAQQTLVTSALVASAPPPCLGCVCTVYCAELLFGPPTAFPLIGPQCTVGVLAGTHWGALRYPGSGAVLVTCARVRPSLNVLPQTEKDKKKTTCDLPRTSLSMFFMSSL